MLQGPCFRSHALNLKCVLATNPRILTSLEIFRLVLLSVPHDRFKCGGKSYSARDVVCAGISVCKMDTCTSTRHVAFHVQFYLDLLAF